MSKSLIILRADHPFLIFDQRKFQFIFRDPIPERLHVGITIQVPVQFELRHKNRVFWIESVLLVELNQHSFGSLWIPNQVLTDVVHDLARFEMTIKAFLIFVQQTTALRAIATDDEMFSKILADDRKSIVLNKPR